MAQAIPLNKVIMDQWMGADPAPHAVLADKTAMPPGVDLFIGVNDGDALSQRRLLKTVGEVSGTNSARLSFAVRNDSLAEWVLGVNGKTNTQQLKFLLQTGPQYHFSFGRCGPIRINYGTSEADAPCFEIPVPLSGADGGCGTPESITGTVHIHDMAGYSRGLDYNLMLDA
jgi:hypothetical protein